MTDIVQPRFKHPGFSGQDVPFYGITFDKTGALQSPQTQATVVKHLADGDFTDVIVFSHGWNNDWDDALEYYTGLLDGVGTMASAEADMLPDGIKPMMIGIGWPSAALVWPSERTPDMAGAGGPEEAEADDEVDDLDILSDGLAPEDAAQLKASLAGKDTLTAAEIDALAVLIAPGFAGAGGDEASDGEATAEALAAMMKSPELAADVPEVPEEDEDEDDNFLPGAAGGGGAGDVQAAGVFDGLFGLRKVVRLATVRKMKDRAGVVGAAGVADLVTALLADTPARVHLVGHSYGCKVVLAAAVNAAVPRQLTSALLLQPAINHYAFASDLGDGRAGGFRPALARVHKPILTTLTNDDFPLRWIFHLANNRRKDFGETPEVAGLLDKYRAMGGYGPAGLSGSEAPGIRIPDPGVAYPDFDAAEVISLAATGKIQGHSDIIVPQVFWAMLQNLAAEA